MKSSYHGLKFEICVGQVDTYTILKLGGQILICFFYIFDILWTPILTISSFLSYFRLLYDFVFFKIFLEFVTHWIDVQSGVCVCVSSIMCEIEDDFGESICGVKNFSSVE